MASNLGPQSSHGARAPVGDSELEINEAFDEECQDALLAIIRD
jgi:hypothetical protein